MIEPKFEYKNIAGVSKRRDPTRIPAGYVRYAVNVDSDNDKKLHRRRGRTLLDDENTHSMWSNASICLCVQAGDLKEATLNLNTMTFTYATLLADVGDTEMIFQDVADMVFFTNAEVFGYIRERVAHGIPEVDQEFKERMVGGHLMEYWDSRLWVFQGNLLHYSDPTEPWVRDKKHNFVAFNSRGRMLRSVKDGLYVSDTQHCLFLQGGVGDPPKFNSFEVCGFPAIEGMSISSVEQVAGISLKVALWATEDGCYMGLPGGQVNRVTGDHFFVDGAARGRVMVLPRIFQNQVKVRQFLGTYDLHPGYGGAGIALEIPAIEVSGRINNGGASEPEPTPEPIPEGSILWLKSDAGITKDAEERISLWEDQSENGNDATQPTDANKPIYQTNQLNGKPSVSFDAIDDFLNCGNDALLDPGVKDWAVAAWEKVAGSSHGDIVAKGQNFQIRISGDQLFVKLLGADVPSEPAGIATDGTYFYISDTFNHKIVKRRASDLSYVSEIGSQGSGNDQFIYPHGIACDGTYLYIPDSYNNRIVKRLCSTLAYVTSIGYADGVGDTFNKPRGAGTDGTHVYIADTDNNRIVKLNCSDLFYVTKIGSNGSGNDQFSLPRNICSDGSHVYVVDTGNHRLVKRHCADLSYDSQIGSSGSGNDQFTDPRGICTDGTYLYIADTTNHRIVKRNCSDLAYVAKIQKYAWVEVGLGDDQFNSPAGICTDNTNLYVADTLNHRAMKFTNAALTFVAKVGTAGSSDEQFNTPIKTASDETYLYISDSLNHRVIKRRLDTLAFVAKVGSYGTGDNQFNTPRGICTDGTHVYIMDGGNRCINKRLCSDLSFVLKLGSNGSGDEQFTTPYGICTDGTYLYVSDAGLHRIVKKKCSDLTYVSKIGSSGSGDDQFNGPRGIGTDGTYLYVADTYNNRVVKRNCSDLAYVSKIGTQGEGNDQFSQPYEVASDGTYIYVLDCVNNRIVKRNCSDLAYVSKTDGTTMLRGSNPERIFSAFGVCCDGTYIYIADSGNHRIVKRLCSDLSSVDTIGGCTATAYATLTADTIQMILVVIDQVNHQIKIYINDSLETTVDISNQFGNFTNLSNLLIGKASGAKFGEIVTADNALPDFFNNTRSKYGV